METTWAWFGDIHFDFTLVHAFGRGLAVVRKSLAPGYRLDHGPDFTAKIYVQLFGVIWRYPGAYEHIDIIDIVL